MRGTPLNTIYNSLYNRITPAGAGNTIMTMLTMWGMKDHPRRCGEHAHQDTVLVSLLGSPPQVRGTLICRISILDSFRITPAGAGNTDNRSLKINIFKLASAEKSLLSLRDGKLALHPLMHDVALQHLFHML